MIHEVIISGRPVQISIECNHPNVKDSTCPTRYGDCGNCEHCITVAKTKDILPWLETLKRA